MARGTGLFQQLPDVVRRAREEQGLTQKALATKAGVSTSTVSRLEAGAGASFATVDQVLRVLGIGDWPDLLEEFAFTAGRGDRGNRYSQRVPTEAPPILRVDSGRSQMFSIYLQVAERRILLTLNVYDLGAPGSVQRELHEAWEGTKR
jgi:transcriptional regulator with XRE-family HTH domain